MTGPDKTPSDREPASVVEICSVADFHSAIETTWGGHYLFRGENSASYSLHSKYGRAAAANSLNDRGRERGLLAEFQRRAAPHIDRAPTSDWEWLAVAQHFGLSTRLLDWTENPLIGAFFAVRGDKTTDSALYVLDTAAVTRADRSVSPFDIATTVLYYPPHVATRITSQAGVFTVHPNPADAFTSPGLTKWIIKRDCLLRLQLTLALYGITESFVFGDLDGLTRELNTRWIWGVTVQ